MRNKLYLFFLTEQKLISLVHSQFDSSCFLHRPRSVLNHEVQWYAVCPYLKTENQGSKTPNGRWVIRTSVSNFHIQMSLKLYILFLSFMFVDTQPCLCGTNSLAANPNYNVKFYSLHALLIHFPINIVNATHKILNT